MRIQTAIACGALVALAWADVGGFADEGHRIVGRLAELHLRNARALEEVRKILRPRETLADAAIWADTIKKRPLNVRAHNNLGAEYNAQGRPLEAAHHFQEVIKIIVHWRRLHTRPVRRRHAKIAEQGEKFLVLILLDHPVRRVRELEQLPRLGALDPHRTGFGDLHCGLDMGDVGLAQ
jgi:hypothetical protein